MPDNKRELAAQVVLNFDAGMLGHYGLIPGAVAQAAVPVVLAGLDWFGRVIGNRRLENDVDVVADGADAYEAETGGDFAEFIRAAVSDAEHQELLARALTIGQDTALRGKRSALGRALASAASETGTKVDDELLFMRVLADLDAPHIRCLAIMRGEPLHLSRYNDEMKAIGQPPVRQWHPTDVASQDPGLRDVVWALLPVLAHHALISGGHEVMTWAGREPEYVITGYGEFLLDRLAEPPLAIPAQG